MKRYFAFAKIAEFCTYPHDVLEGLATRSNLAISKESVAHSFRYLYYAPGSFVHSATGI